MLQRLERARTNVLIKEKEKAKAREKENNKNNNDNNEKRKMIVKSEWQMHTRRIA